MMKRLNVIKWVVILIFIVLISRLGYLQIVQGRYYVRLSDGNRIRVISIKASRGIFYDRNGVPLVSKRPSFSVVVANLSHPIPDSVIIKLSNLLDMKPEDIRAKINLHVGSPFEPIWIKSDVDQETITKIEENRSSFPGVVIQAQPVRKYIYQNFAAHIFGYVGEISETELKIRQAEGYITGDIVGKSGLEKVYDKYIRGTVGAERIEVDANGTLVEVLGKKQPIIGNDLVVTLDYNIQRAAEKAIDPGLFSASDSRYIEKNLKGNVNMKVELLQTVESSFISSCLLGG